MLDSNPMSEYIIKEKGEAKMKEIVFYKELQGLPEELERWCEKALAQIESPEKRDEAAKDLRERIEILLKECLAQDTEEKTKEVLKKLGKPESMAVELEQRYKIKDNKKVDKVAGCVCLVLGIVCGIISFILFYSNQNQVFFNDSLGYMQGAYKSGVGVGAGAVCAIVFVIIGIRLLLFSRSERK